MLFISKGTLAHPVAISAIVLLLAGSAVFAEEPLRPEEPDDPARWGAPVKLEEIGAGELLWKSDRGLVPLPSAEIAVELSVTGVLLHGRVEQSFHNPTGHTVEVLYVFPLPDRAAVNRMELRIGDRTIRSVIREREQARRTYEQAKASGRKAALVQGHRPNLFTTSAANINPGETVSIVLEYLDQVDFADGTFSLTFPLAHTPRYTPHDYLDGADDDERAALTGSMDVGDAVVPEARVEVRLQTGVDLEAVDSPSHGIQWAADGEIITVRTHDERVPARRDFRLLWTPSLSEEPLPVVLVEKHEEGRFAMVMLFPPIPGSEAGLGLATETLFVVDVSGSMGGPSIEQARLALTAALNRLRPDDRFNILKFSNSTSEFRPEFAYADVDALNEAREWVSALEASGGTEIHGALLRALELMGSSGSSHAQRIIFLTDGAVSNEDQVFRTIAERLGRTRLHAIGIGSAPNAHLMRKMAGFGRGLCSFVTTSGEADNLIDHFFSRLDRPVMTDLALDWEGLSLEDGYPARLPDLHAGEPLVAYGRMRADGSIGRVRLEGQTRAGWIETSAELSSAAPRRAGIAARWARSRVEALLDSLHEGADLEGVRRDVVDLALAFDLVTRYTSLVAVEEVPTAVDDARSIRLASALPQGGTEGPLRLLLGLFLLAGGAAFLVLLRR